MAVIPSDYSSTGRHDYGKWQNAISHSHAGFSMADFDQKRPCLERLHARSLGIIGMHDDRCYEAESYLILRIINKIRRGRRAA